MFRVPISLLFVVLTACSGSGFDFPDPVSGPEEPAPSPAPDLSGQLSSSGALMADSDRYVLRRTERGWEVTIPYRYTNPTSGPVFVTTCNRPTPPHLQRLEGRRWLVAWAPTVPACLGPPLRIEVGGTHSDELWVFAGYRGNNYYPKFDDAIDDPEGVYRLVWSPRSSYQPHLPFGPLLPPEHLVSPAFELVEGD